MEARVKDSATAGGHLKAKLEPSPGLAGAQHLSERFWGLSNKSASGVQRTESHCWVSFVLLGQSPGLKERLRGNKNARKTRSPS